LGLRIFPLSVIIVILVNAVTLGLETSPALYDYMGGFLHILDRVILAIFVLEIVLKLIGHGGRFFLNAWNVFDFVIVAIALVPAAAPSPFYAHCAFSAFCAC
jgi:voltage-gated sodium channel